MFDESKKPIMIICICLTALFATLACVLANSGSGGNGLAPIRSLTLEIDKSQREELVDQFRKFADDQSFEIDVTDYNTNGQNVQVWMAGDGMQIIVFFNRKEPNKASLDFYSMQPGDPADEQKVDELLADLKAYINKIPNVTITEE